MSLLDFPPPHQILSDKPKQSHQSVYSDLLLEENDQSKEFTLSDYTLDI